LPNINAELQKKGLDPIQTITQQQWKKTHNPDASPQPGGTPQFREVD